MTHLYNTVALLPMKANSERIKGKNFKNFCGKPLFEWMLHKLIAEDLIDKIVINTDAIEELKKFDIISNNKVLLRNRPTEICGDYVSMNKVIEDDVNNIEAKTYFMTHTTNPLLSSTSIKKALKYYQSSINKGFDSLFSVNKIQSRFYDSDCLAINHDPKNLIRTQDLQPYFEENSNFYIFSNDSFKKTRARIGLTPQMYITEPYESTDIDTPSDWELAEILVSYYEKKGTIV